MNPTYLDHGSLRIPEARCLTLPYFRNPVDVFRRLRDLGDAVLLDSAASGDRARWDIIAAAPDHRPGLTLGAETGADELETALSRFTATASTVIHAHRDRRDSAEGLPRSAAAETSSAGDATTGPEPPAFPFLGGYIGHLSYELGRRLQGLPPRTVGSPLASVRHYPWAVLQDRAARRSWLVGTWDDALAEELLGRLRAAPEEARPSFQLTSPFQERWDLPGFRRVFDRVQELLRAGDCYQINIAQPFEASFRGDPLDAYRALRELAGAPFCAYLPLADGSTLMSLSPERFLTVNRGEVETRPIKGTRPRSSDPGTDHRAARALLASEKERAENLMIVDLLRNDIGRFCVPGSVRAEALFQVESFPTVHHLVSAVRGRLAAEFTPLDLLLGCMPGGSITGAPKHRAMELIDELEAAPREAWCGSVFYLSDDGQLDSNIAIRSLFSRGDRLRCWAGGGLVYDSDAGAEYAEQRHKVGAFLDALESGFSGTANQ